MSRRTISVAVAGAGAGVVLALMILALAANYLVETAAEAAFLSERRSLVRPHFAANAGSVYLMVTGVAAIAGAVIATVTAAIAGKVKPEEPRFGPWAVAALGAGVAAATTYAVLRSGFGSYADITRDITSGQTIITITMFRAVITAILCGAAAGAATAVSADLFSQRNVVGLEGEAWPSRSRFTAESMRAMLIPLGALVAIVVVVFGLAEVFLTGEEEFKNFAVVIASAFAALVLAVAAFIASHPRRPDREE